MSKHKEHFETLEMASFLNSVTASSNGQIDDAEMHKKESLMFGLKSQATHKLDHDLYKVSGDFVLLLDNSKLEYVKSDINIDRLIELK